jgi:hypothetical protein
MPNFTNSFILSNLSNSNVQRKLQIVSMMLGINKATAVFEVFNHNGNVEYSSGPLAAKTNFILTIDNSTFHNAVTGAVEVSGVGTLNLLISIIENGGSLSIDTVLTNYINSKIASGFFNQ